MLADVIIGIGNGYESNINVTKDLIHNDMYDCCIKYGIDEPIHIFEFKNKQISLRIIPSAILYGIPCLIGSGCDIDIDLLKKDIEILEELEIDVELYLFLDDSTIFNKPNDLIQLKHIQFNKLIRLLGYVPNIINFISFLKKFRRPLFISSNGLYKSDGNNYASTDISRSNTILSIVNPRYVGNIYGLINIFDIFNNYNKKNILEIYNVFQNSSDLDINFKTNNCLLSYNWLNLDNLKNSIELCGANIIYILGQKILQKLSVYGVYNNNELIMFEEFNSLIDFIITSLLKVDGVSQILFY